MPRKGDQGSQALRHTLDALNAGPRRACQVPFLGLCYSPPTIDWPKGLELSCIQLLREACDRGYCAGLDLSWDVQGTDNKPPASYHHPCKTNQTQARPPRLTPDLRPCGQKTRSHPSIHHPTFHPRGRLRDIATLKACNDPSTLSHSHATLATTFLAHQLRRITVNQAQTSPYYPPLIEARNLPSPWRNHTPPSSTSPNLRPTRTLHLRCRELFPSPQTPE